MKDCWLVKEEKCHRRERGFFRKERPCMFCRNMAKAAEIKKQELIKKYG